MRIKKAIIKVLTIGSIFFISGINFGYIVSSNNPTITGFWSTSKLPRAFAGDDDDDDDDHKRKSSGNTGGGTSTGGSTGTGIGGGSPTTCTTTSASGVTTTVACSTTGTGNSTSGGSTGTGGGTSTGGSTGTGIGAIGSGTGTNNSSTGQLTSGVFTGNGIYSFPGGSSTYTVEITTNSGKITNAKWISFLPSGNGLYSQAMGDAVLQKLIANGGPTVSTITGATGTANAINNAIANAIANSRGASTSGTGSNGISSTNGNTSTGNSNSNNSSNNGQSTTVSTTSGASGSSGNSSQQSSYADQNSIVTDTVKQDSITKTGAYINGIYTGDGLYKYSGGSSVYTVEITIDGGKITKAAWLKFLASGNGLYTREKGDKILADLIANQTNTINSVTGASGTVNAVNDAIRNALNKARNISQTDNSNALSTQKKIVSDKQKKALKSGFENSILKFEEELSTPDLIAVLKKAEMKLQANYAKSNEKMKPIFEFVLDMISTKMKDQENMEFTSPNGNKYILILLPNKQYTFQRSDGSISSNVFKNYYKINKYLVENTLYKVISDYTAPNGKKFTIIQNQKDLSYKFKWADGSVGNNSYISKDTLVYNLKINNELPPVVANSKLYAIAKKKILVSAPVKVKKIIQTTVKPVIQAKSIVQTYTTTQTPGPVVTAKTSTSTKAS